MFIYLTEYAYIMTVKKVIIKDHSIFPEALVQTNGQSLVTGSSTIFHFDKINTKSQIVVPLSFSVESLASSTVAHRVDNVKDEDLTTDCLRGIANNNVVHDQHELKFATKDYKLEAQNSTGGASADHRSRIVYLVDALTTARKLTNGLPLARRDIEAMKILKQRHNIDVEKLVKRGMGIPAKFEQFLTIHEVNDAKQYTMKTALSTTSRSTLVDVDVPKGYAYVLEGIHCDVGAQTTVGEVNMYISRDGDVDLLTLDPACFPSSQTPIQLHIHAFENFKVEFDLNSGTHNNFKAYASFSIRKLGAGFKAKMLEFAPNSLPTHLDPTDEEMEIINSQNLKEIARTGVMPIA